MVGELQLAQTTFSSEKSDANGIFREKDHGQDGRLSSKIYPQGLRTKLEGTWGAGQCQLPVST